MRAASRISKTPSEFRRDERAYQARLVEQLQSELELARDRDAPWYVWVRDVWGPRRRGET